MRILVVTPFLAAPGLDGGGTLMFNLIRNLAARHEILYLSFAGGRDLPRKSLLEPFCKEVLVVPLPGVSDGAPFAKVLHLAYRLLQNVLSFVTFTPVVARKCMSREMHAAIVRIIGLHKPDVVHLCFPQMAHYIQACADIPAVMDTSDAALVGVFRRAMKARQLWAKTYYLIQWLFWVRYESCWFPRFGKILTVSGQDAAALRMVLPDADVYAGAVAVEVSGDPVQANDAGGRIGFLASFGHQPNVDAARYFAEQIFPLVRKKLAEAEFVVAGKNPPSFLLGRSGAGIECVGFVEDVAAFYGSVDVVVAPVRYGGGIKIKVLEAMACGKAVVTTSVGAEGIVNGEEETLLIADEPAHFAQEVVALLQDEERRITLGERARRMIGRHFSWQRLLDDMDRIYNGLVRERR